MTPGLDWITIEGFRSIRSVEQLELRPVNVIIGANGSGKSNFVGVFSFLQAIRAGRLREHVARAGGAERILHFGSRITERLQLEVSFRHGVNRYRIELVPNDLDQLVPISETVAFWNKSKHERPWSRSLDPRQNGREAGISGSAPPGSVAAYVRTRLGTWRLFHFHDTSVTSPIKRTCDINDNRFLRADGSNLPAYLYRIQADHPHQYDLIQRTVALAAPFFEAFILEPMARRPNMLRLEWKHRGTDRYFDASSLSDGTLRFMALTTLLLQPAALRPGVVLLDEPELGLHPYAITLLASMIRAAAVETQVVLATQSALLLDHFDPEDVLVVERVEEATRFARLEPARLAPWLEDYSLGQLWEKNEFGGRPGSA